jgi:hypothetical protein
MTTTTELTRAPFEPPEKHHPFLSPSGGLPRGYLCPGSPFFVHALKAAGFIKEVHSDAAAKGTLLHEHVDPSVALDALDVDDRELIEKARGFVAAKTKGATHVLYEVPVPIRAANGRLITWGTVDVLALFADGHAVVIDLKFHRNEPPGKTFFTLQGQGYSLGVMDRYKVERVDCYIYLPRMALEFHDVYEDAEVLRALVAGIESSVRRHPDVFRPGPEQCQYCEARSRCPSAESYATELTKAPPTVPADPSARGEMLAKLEAVVGIAESVIDRIKTEAKEGGVVPDGYRVIECQGNRFVPREALTTAAEALNDPTAVLEQCSISVKQFEALLKDKGCDTKFLERLPRKKPTKKILRSTK